MDNNDLTLAMRLQADARNFVAGLGVGKRAVVDFTGSTKERFEGLNRLVESMSLKIGSIGVGFGAAELVMEAARTEKAYSRIGIAANASEGQIEELRRKASEVAAETGLSGDSVRIGVDALVQANVGIEKTIASTRGLGQEMAITSANGDVLANILAHVNKNFDFDLSKPKAAVDVFEQINAAGFRGAKQIEGVSQTLDALGGAPKKLKMPLDELLAFMRVLSDNGVSNAGLPSSLSGILRPFTESNPLADRSQSVFNFQGRVRFFDKNKNRRDPLDILTDIRKEYQHLDKRTRELYLGYAYGRDPDAASGMRILMQGDNLDRLRTKFSGDKSLEEQMRLAIDHSVDQVGRLKNALGDAVEPFSDKLNHGISATIKKVMDSKEQGGLGLSGGEIILGGLGSLIAGGALAKYGGKSLKRLMGFGTVAAGVAEGAVLQKVAGVTPVFVVNMPGALAGAAGAGIPTAVESIAGGTIAAKAGKGLLGTRSLAAIIAGLGGDATAIGLLSGGVLAAGAGGYGIGTLANAGINYSDRHFGTNMGDAIGKAVATALSALGSDTAARALTVNGQQEQKGTIRIELDSKGNARLGSLDPTSDFNFQLGNGMLMMGQNG